MLDDWYVIAVQDAYRVLPFADILYGCDERWWNVHKGAPDFWGRKWSCHQIDNGRGNDKRPVAEQYKVRLVRGDDGDIFSDDPQFIRYGGNALFQAMNIALLLGVDKITLVGADMRHVDSRSHFFGDHPPSLYTNPNFARFIPAFETAAENMTREVEIINATPGSALRCWPVVSPEEALGGTG